MWLQKTYVLEKSVRVSGPCKFIDYSSYTRPSHPLPSTANRKVVALDVHFFIMAFDSARFSANWARANRPWADLIPFIFVVHQRFADCSKRNCQAMDLAALSRHPSYEVFISPCRIALQQGRPNKTVLTRIAFAHFKHTKFPTQWVKDVVAQGHLVLQLSP